MEDNEKISTIRSDAARIAREVAEAAKLGSSHILVIGASTSEIAGQRIGTSGTLDIAQELVEGIRDVQREFGFQLAFQCCEHLNRALVVERVTLERYRLDEVAAVPVPKAGGSMAAYAYNTLTEPCLAETIEANAGIDIGETLIGMHLKRVAVPYRPALRFIGEARVTAARTRPKLIGGERAVYAPMPTAPGTCD
ncbi:TIGR01440 family protein [Paenibacillus campi]|uniref:TIGR01440 family protein n=1 Tax=Paenibacillus campi TaxID=3106031 RepID=UPI002B001F7F|nr:TIGR01440 family protein [Paenibacillus sp. SGZ-1014]